MPEWNGVRAALLDPIGAEAGGVRRWAARLENGSPATAIQAPLGSAVEAEAAAGRLSRLHAHAHENLEPVLGWASEGSEVWVLTDAAGGQSLRTLLEGGALTVPEAVSVGEGVLAGLDSLYLAGLHHGSLSERNVWVTPAGVVRLRGQGLSPQGTPGPAEFAADLRAAGAVICSALGIAPRPDPAGEMGLAERAAPALAATARAIANGAMGGNVTLAHRSFAETAGPLLAGDRLAASRHQLAQRFRPAPAAAVVPPGPSPPPAAPAPVAPPPPPPPRPRTTLERSPVLEDEPEPGGRSRGRVALTVAGIMLLVLLLGGGAVLVFSLATAQPVAQGTPSPAPAASPAPSPVPTPRPSPSAAVSPRARPSASPSPSTSPGAVPTYAPAADGNIKAVSIRVDGPCDLGASCTIEITVDFTAVLPDATDVAWAFKIYNPCTAATADAGSNHFLAQKGWNRLIGDSTFHLPSTKASFYLVGVTSTPAVAASKPLQIGTGTC